MTEKGIYKIKANEFEFSFSAEQIASADLVQKSASSFNLIKDHRSVNATLVAADITAKQVTIQIEGENYIVSIHDELNQMLSEMGFDQSVVKQIKEIKAPMPGLVLEVSVAAGDKVLAGDQILILSAMKMENSITIPANATIKRIAVSVGQAVEKGQVLVELE